MFYSNSDEAQRRALHPLREPRWEAPITSALIENIYSGCRDFEHRRVLPGLFPGGGLSVCWLDGVVDGGAVSEYVLRPLTEAIRCGGVSGAELIERIEAGAVYSCSLHRCEDADSLVSDLGNGYAAIIFDAEHIALSFELRTQNSRAVSEPSAEKSGTGAKDAFVETLRINTSLVRRKLRTPDLKLRQTVVGRRSHTGVAIIYIEGVAREEVVSELTRRLNDIDIDGLLATGDIDEYIADDPHTPFPQVMHTERADKFAMALLDGRVGLLADGLPVGFLVPATLDGFMRAPEDKGQHFAVASMLTLMRWSAFIITLTLPALLVAFSMYHQELLPTPLLLSMVSAKQHVPFSSAVEVVAMLFAFELLQEAGLRLPDPVGQTVSIIGALIVGQSAVDARVVSPIAVIAVALAGICSYTMPSQDMGAALRIYRFLFVLAGAAAGLFGVTAAMAILVWRLCSMRSFGTPYTSPLTGGDGSGLWRRIIRLPLKLDKLRDPDLAGEDLRRQK